MAAHIATGTMLNPQNFMSKQLEHLGLVVAMFDELGIEKLIDSLLPQDKESVAYNEVAALS